MRFSPRQRKELSDFLQNTCVKEKMDSSVYKKRGLLYPAFYDGKASLQEKLEENMEFIHHVQDDDKVLRYISYGLGGATVVSILFQEPVVSTLLGSTALLLYLSLRFLENASYKDVVKENKRVKEKLKALEKADIAMVDIKVELEKIKGELSSGNLSDIRTSLLSREISFINEYFRRKYSAFG